MKYIVTTHNACRQHSYSKWNNLLYRISYAMTGPCDMGRLWLVLKLIKKGNVITAEVLVLLIYYRFLGTEIGIDGSEKKPWKVNGIIQIWHLS